MTDTTTARTSIRTIKGFSVLITAITAIAALAVGGCSSSATGSGDFQCAFGELTGTWRVHYQETDGNCGELPDETVVLGAAQDPNASKCTYAANAISADKCRIDEDFTCPTNDNQGSQHWVGSLRHTGNGAVSGSFTVQLNHPTLGTCRSTYTVTWTEQ